MTILSIWSGVGGFVGRLISLFPIAWMCLIWFNIDLFYWIFVLTMLLYLRDAVTWTLLHFPFSCWIDIAYITFWTFFLLFFFNDKYTYISIVYLWTIFIPWAIVCWLGDIWHIMMFSVFWNNTNRSSSWWEISIDFKNIIFDEGMI